MPINFTPLDEEEGGTGITFTPLDEKPVDPKRVVKPGDVAARKQQMAADAAAEGPNRVRENLTFGGELVGGFKNFAGGVVDVASALFPGGKPIGDLVPDVGMDKSLRENLGAVVSSPLARIPLGAVQAVASPLAPLSNLAARGGEAIADATGSDTLAALGMSVADVLAPGALAKGAKALKPVLKAGTGESGLTRFLDHVSPEIQNKIREGVKLNKTKALEAAKRGEANIAGSEQRAAEAITTAQREAEAAKAGIQSRSATNVAQSEQLRDVGIREAQQQAQAAGRGAAKIRADESRDLALARSGAEAEAESVRSMAEAAKRHIPSDEELLRNVAGKELGENVGAQFKSTYSAARESRAKEFKELYDGENGVYGKADKIQLAPEKYKAAFEDVLGEGGISRPLPTQAEKAAGSARAAMQPKKGAPEIDEAFTDQIDALESQIKSATSPAEKAGAQEALREMLGGRSLPPDPTAGDLMRELKRLRAGHRLATVAKDDNLARQFGKLEAGLTDDLKGTGLLEELSAVDKRYATEFAPYFDKRSVTRSIAEGSPERVAMDIIRPSSDKKAVEKITRAFELIDDPAQKQAVAHAHLNSLVDDAARSGDFASTFVKRWEKYTNPSGNANKVLRTAYGREYDRINSLVNQFRNGTTRTFDEVAEAIVASGSKRLKANEAAITAKAAAEAGPLEALLKGTPDAIEGVVKGTRNEVAKLRTEAARAGKDVERGLQGSIKTANTARDIEVKLLKKQIQDDVAKFTKGRAKYQDGHLVPAAENNAGKFIGQLYIVESVFDGLYKGAGAFAYKLVAGGMLMLSRAAMNRMLASERGVGLLKNAARNAPGSTAAAANARMVQAFLEKLKKEEEATDER